MTIKGPDEAQAVVGMKGLEDFFSRAPITTRRKTRFAGTDPTSTAKPPTWCPTKSARKRKTLRVRKTVQNRRIDLLATDSDRQNRQRRHISGEASPRQRRHCSSILVSPQKDVDAVTAEYTGY